MLGRFPSRRITGHLTYVDGASSHAVRRHRDDSTMFIRSFSLACTVILHEPAIEAPFARKQQPYRRRTLSTAQPCSRSHRRCFTISHSISRLVKRARRIALVAVFGVVDMTRRIDLFSSIVASSGTSVDVDVDVFDPVHFAV